MEGGSLRGHLPPKAVQPTRAGSLTESAFWKGGGKEDREIDKGKRGKKFVMYPSHKARSTGRVPRRFLLSLRRCMSTLEHT